MSFKILHLIDSGGLYGAEKMLLALVQEQMKQGLEPMILSAGELGIEDKPIELEAKRQGIPVTPWRMKPGLNLRVMREILQWAKVAGYELLHSHGYKFNVLLGVMPRKKRGLPAVCTLHGYVHARRFTKMWIYELIDRWAIGQLDAVVLVSDAMKQEIGQGLASQAVVIPNGLAIDAIQADAKKNLAPEIKLFYEAHRPLILGVGRLSQEKGFDRLVSSFALFKQHHPKAGLLILGEGRKRADLEDAIEGLQLSDSAMMPGYSNAVAACIGSADVLAMPSHTEGLPITLLEAMAIGTPIVASGVGAIPETLGHGEGGFVVDNVTPESLAEALDMACRADLNSESKTRWALEKVAACFSVKSMEEQYRGVYRRATSV